ncbi:MAG: DUF3883 domain-containing protein [bacterium]|nr:DUF3883 domain-containing protein [bacterium]
MKQELQKAMLVGMYLSKYDKQALNILGFESFIEAYNAIGLAINVRPLSIRNYRDEFDPIFPNKRKGWWKRPMFQTRVDMFNQYRDLNLEAFTDLVKNIIYQNPAINLIEEKIEYDEDKSRTFAKRLITGQAAEQYFKDNYQSVPAFNGLAFEETTKFGCGFDFRILHDAGFYAIEVKGLEKAKGAIGLTDKEYKTAFYLKENYFVFLVKNFIETPVYNLFKNPVFSHELDFVKNERMIQQVSWNASV